MSKIVVLETEVELINYLIKNGLKIELNIVDDGDVNFLSIKYKEEEIVWDFQWLVDNSDDELRFNTKEEVLEYLKTK
jgi:hypothetical protein